MSERPSIEERVSAIWFSRGIGEEHGDFTERIEAAVLALCRDLVREENVACEAICKAEAEYQTSIGIIEEAAGAWTCAEKIAARRTTA